MLPDIQPGNTKILYFFNCLLDGMHTKYRVWSLFGRVSFACGKSEVIFFLLLSSYSKKTPTSKVGDELRLLPT